MPPAQVNIQLQYLGECPPAPNPPAADAEDLDSSATDSSVDEAAAPKPAIGRTLDLTVDLTVQRMLQINSCSFFIRDVLRHPSVTVRLPVPLASAGCHA